LPAKYFAGCLYLIFIGVLFFKKDEDDLHILEATILKEDSVLKRKIIGAEVAFNKEYEGFKVRGFIDLGAEALDDGNNQSNEMENLRYYSTF